MKLTAPRILPAPDKCKANMPKSTAPPECAIIPLRGGYRVQPVPTPASIKAELNNNNNDGGNNQYEILFNLGGTKHYFRF